MRSAALDQGDIGKSALAKPVAEMGNELEPAAPPPMTTIRCRCWSLGCGIKSQALLVRAGGRRDGPFTLQASRRYKRIG